MTKTIPWLIVLGMLAGQASLTGPAAKLYQQAIDTGHFYSAAAKLKPEVWPTSDGRSFLVIWKTTPAPAHWIVTLHGTGSPPKGFATDDLAVWEPHVRDRQVGLVCLRWWLGGGDRASDFLTPDEMYREIDGALQKLGVKPGSAMLFGFSRGASNSYAVMALDAGRGKHYFTLAVASSGGASLNYPPNQDIVRGKYGDHPLKGTRWITGAGGRDPHPDRDGIEGMRLTASWLKEQGATIVDAVEDPNRGHGALMLSPQNARRALDPFFK